MKRLEAPARRLRLAVDCDTMEQLLTLLTVTKSLGLRPHLGAANGVDEEAAPAIRKYARQKKPKANGDARPEVRTKHSKRYSMSMLVRMSDQEPALQERVIAPADVKVWQVLKAEFGDQPFRKGDAKQVLVKRLKLSSPTNYVSHLMRGGGLIPADSARR